MLEQAVYAGRNHTFSLAVALTLLAWAAPAARATDVGRVSLGSTIDTLVAGPDGGAWAGIERRRGFAIARLGPEGSFVTTAVDEPIGEDVAIGPDGHAWFSVGRSVVRSASDPAGSITRLELDTSLGDVSATGADGTLWSVGSLGDQLLHVTPAGDVTSTPLPLPDCGSRPQYRSAARASDGAVWLADSGCSRFIRIAPDGSPQVFALHDDEAPFALAADAAGGAWFAQVGTPVRIGHVDAAGTVTRLRPTSRYGAVTGVAVGPDGSAWFAFARCSLGRVPPGGTFTLTPAPIPVQRLVFDPAGGMWLASAARIVRTTPAALERTGCDDEPPAVRLRPAFRRSVSLAELRRGFRITVREPSVVELSPFYGEDDDGQSLVTIVKADRGRTVTFRVPGARIRRYERALAAGRHPELSLYVEVTDSEGNVEFTGGGGRRVTG